MIFLFGPLYSGKRTAARELLGCDAAELSRRAVWDVQDLAALCCQAPGTDSTAAGADGPSDGPAALEALADRLAQYEVVIATEVGGGVVPVDRRAREAREAAGRLNLLLAARAEAVVRVFCGIPVLVRGELPPRPAAG